MHMVLKPQDIVISLKLLVLDGRSWTYVLLAHELAMSASEINAGVKRARIAQLLSPPTTEKGNPLPNRRALLEFLIHGIRYAFPPDRGELTRGMPTGYAAAPLCREFIYPDDLPPVWPSPEGKVRGVSFSPLYPTVPKAAAADQELYELLALVDAVRGGRARERDLAAKELRKRLRQ